MNVSEDFHESLSKLYPKQSISGNELGLASGLLFQLAKACTKHQASQVKHSATNLTPSHSSPISDAGRGKIRYVGGMCIAKAWYHFKNIVMNKMYIPQME